MVSLITGRAAVLCLPDREHVAAWLTERPGRAHNAPAGALCFPDMKGSGVRLERCCEVL